MAAQGYHLARSLSDSPTPTLKSGFHIPPFSSVPHLHLHVFVLPHTFIGRFKYPLSERTAAQANMRGSSQGKPDDRGEVGLGQLAGQGRAEGKGTGKGWSWFVSAEQTVEILEKGGTVGLGRS
jgi:hypothetical protein